MPKPLITVLILVGFLFFLLGSFSHFFLFLGLIMIAAGLYFGIGPDGILRKEQVVDEWAILIEKAHTRAEDIFNNTDLHIKENKVPFIETKRQIVSPSAISSLAGSGRDFLIVTNHDSLRMAPYRIFLNARDYGENLDISWFLTFKPTILQALLSLIPYVNIVPKTVNDINLFDQQDLRAYATVVHHATLQSANQLMQSLSQDTSKMERKSRGFLGIS